MHSSPHPYRFRRQKRRGRFRPEDSSRRATAFFGLIVAARAGAARSSTGAARTSAGLGSVKTASALLCFTGADGLQEARVDNLEIAGHRFLDLLPLGEANEADLFLDPRFDVKGKFIRDDLVIC